LCSNIKANSRQHLEVPGAGHYGIFSGRRWREVVYPAVVKFILAHNDVGTKKKPVGKTLAKPVSKASVKTTSKPTAKAAVKRTVKAAATQAASRKK
jgi:poly(3-hydroxybutyrate) depolymerase